MQSDKLSKLTALFIYLSLYLFITQMLVQITK